MKRAFFKLRAANVDQQRTLKSDAFQACSLWNLKTVTDVHRHLEYTSKEKARLKELEKSIVARGEQHAMIAERLAMWEAERHCRFQAELQAAVEPAIEERNREQKKYSRVQNSAPREDGTMGARRDNTGSPRTGYQT